MPTGLSANAVAQVATIMEKAHYLNGAGNTLHVEGELQVKNVEGEIVGYIDFSRNIVVFVTTK